MEKISIKDQTDQKNSWLFSVSVGSLNYQVILTKDYYQKLTQGKIEPEELIIKSFEFLLQRESKESILREFNLQQINDYFSGFEQELDISQ